MDKLLIAVVVAGLSATGATAQSTNPSAASTNTGTPPRAQNRGTDAEVTRPSDMTTNSVPITSVETTTGTTSDTTARTTSPTGDDAPTSADGRRTGNSTAGSTSGLPSTPAAGVPPRR